MSANTTTANNDGALKSILVAGAVAFVCALVVSFTAVTLRPYQDANLEAERQARIRAIVAGIPGLGQLAQAGAVRTYAIELGTARVEVPQNLAALDTDAQLQDETRSIAIPPAEDIAQLKRRENTQVFYAIENTDGTMAVLILPVRGLGYVSTIKGYLAMAGDGRTVRGIEFYEHGETPGLGARIDDAAWKSKWVDKQSYNAQGIVTIEVVKGQAQNEFEVDGITGATRTSDGVSDMVRFWLGPLGYGPYLETLREGQR